MHSSGPCTVEADSGWRSHPFRQSMPGFPYRKWVFACPDAWRRFPGRYITLISWCVSLLLQWIVEKALPGWESGGKK